MLALDLPADDAQSLADDINSLEHEGSDSGCEGDDGLDVLAVSRIDSPICVSDA
ncbi:hypothetical protein [Streptomyces sp. Agncl-13]|uniref:hypothetical protein n=1 Tax=Streptomyces sp. Agncl-13 TaxID=3400628 RepID=UPI003A89FEFE